MIFSGRSLSVFLAASLVITGCFNTGATIKGLENDGLVGTYQVTAGDAEFTVEPTYFIFGNDLAMGPTAIFLRSSGSRVVFAPNPIYYGRFEQSGDTIHFQKHLNQDVEVTGKKVADSELAGQILLASQINVSAGQLQAALRSRKYSVSIIAGTDAIFTPAQFQTLQTLNKYPEVLIQYLEQEKATEIWVNSGGFPSDRTTPYLWITQQEDRILVIPEMPKALEELELYQALLHGRLEIVN